MFVSRISGDGAGVVWDAGAGDAVGGTLGAPRGHGGGTAPAGLEHSSVALHAGTLQSPPGIIF